MWKLLFDTGYIFSCLIPCTKWREHFRVHIMFDYKNKLRALYTQYPEFKHSYIKLCKGGGSLAFIVDNKTVYKVRKRNANVIHERIAIEKRLTDALRPFCEVQIPQIEIVNIGHYVFYKQVFIPGSLLVKMPLCKIIKNIDKLTSQLAKIIHDIYTADPKEIRDLKTTQEKLGWVNSDMCSNILINPKTMQITGIIDWEWTSYTDIKQAFKGLYWVSHKMNRSGIGPATEKKHSILYKE